jgi:predicted DNA-binding transcriptional regulator AlpA
LSEAKMIERSTREFTDEWWTTEQVLGFLKMKRKALWDLRKRPDRAFPAPARFGGKFNLYPGDEVRVWAENQARGNRPRPAPRKRVGGPSIEPKPTVTAAPLVAPATGAVATKSPATKPRRRRAQDANQMELFG